MVITCRERFGAVANSSLIFPVLASFGRTLPGACSVAARGRGVLGKAAFVRIGVVAIRLVTVFSVFIRLISIPFVAPSCLVHFFVCDPYLGFVWLNPFHGSDLGPHGKPIVKSHPRSTERGKDLHWTYHPSGLEKEIHMTKISCKGFFP